MTRMGPAKPAGGAHLPARQPGPGARDHRGALTPDRADPRRRSGTGSGTRPIRARTRRVR